MKTKAWLSIMTLFGFLASSCDDANGSVMAPGDDNRPIADQRAIQPQTVTRMLVEIENASDGSCSNVSEVTSRGKSGMIESCHGWIIASCSDLMFFQTRGVRADAGTIVVPSAGQPEGRRLSATELVNSAVRARFGRSNEYLHLRFSQARCTASGFDLPFEGSFIASGVSGPANPMHGILSVDERGRHSIEIGLGES